MITIGIDARTYFFRSGLGRYCRNMLSSLLNEFEDCRFIFWLSNQKTVSDFPVNHSENLEIRISQAPFGNLEAEKAVLCGEVNASSVDLFFSPYSPNPIGIRSPRVLTVHDLTAFRFPEMHLESTVKYLKDALAESMMTVTSLVADSECTARDIKTFFPKFAADIAVVPLGVEKRFFAEPDSKNITGILCRYGLKDKNYVLYVGNLETRKNLLRAVQAYHNSSLFGSIPMVLAGAPRWGSEELLDYIRLNNLAEKVCLMDYVSDEDLPVLYRGALFFIYVSLYEGFGLPVLEAMACGPPILVSNKSSLPEVVGNAALFVNPLQIEEIRAGMERLFDDSCLRKNLSNAGMLRAKGFTWEKAAKKLGRILIDTAR